MPNLHAVSGRIVDLQRHVNVHMIHGHRPMGPSDRYEIWIQPQSGRERKFTVNTRTMPARRGHEVSLILTSQRRPEVVGLGNWSTFEVINYVDNDPPPLLRSVDLWVLPSLLAAMVGALGETGAVLFLPVAMSYLVTAMCWRAIARRRLAWRVNWAIDVEARRHCDQEAEPA